MSFIAVAEGQSPPFSVAPITAKGDVIHKTGSTQHIATPPEEDRATAIGDMRTKFREDQSSGPRDMLADRRTDRRVDHNTPHPYRGGVVVVTRKAYFL